MASMHVATAPLPTAVMFVAVFGVYMQVVDRHYSAWTEKASFDVYFHDGSQELQMSIDHEEIETGGGRWRITPVITPLLVNVVQVTPQVTRKIVHAMNELMSSIPQKF